MELNNPFTYKTPEYLTAEEIATLFVNVYTDFAKLKDYSHTFIHGSRGTGKSMMLRYLEPNVLMQAKEINEISELDFYAVHVPIKFSNLNITELRRLKGVSYSSFTELLLTLYISQKIFNSLENIYGKQCNKDEIAQLYENFKELLDLGGWVQNKTLKGNASFKQMELICNREFIKALQYLKRLSFKSQPVSYNGPLLGYLDYLLPLIKYIRELSSFPKVPFFIMLDDVDNLHVQAQKIINNWVSCRTTDFICLKLSTQLRYKTYRTESGQLIESPHDFSEIDISRVYTSKREHYYKRIESIIFKRLSIAGIQKEGREVSPIEFFPKNEKQESAIEKEKDLIRSNWKKGKGRGSRIGDDITRYAVPEYMRKLAGKSKSSSTYSYAGFDNLVDISSGVIRWFLESASRMYDELSAANGSKLEKLQFIPHQIQDQVIKKWSEEFMLQELDRLRTTEETDDGSQSDDKFKDEITYCPLSNVPKLSNLVNSLGGLFRIKLLDPEAAERKVMSIMISGKIDEKLMDVLELGVETGFLVKSTVSNKEGWGKNFMFVLSKRLAPYFRLDPNGYSHHLSIKAKDLLLACENPSQFINLRTKSEKSAANGIQLEFDSIKDIND